jgi:hypothetical protein
LMLRATEGFTFSRLSRSCFWVVGGIFTGVPPTSMAKISVAERFFGRLC